MNLEQLYQNNLGLLHHPGLRGAIYFIQEYALRYQEVVTGDQYPILKLLGVKGKHSFFEARWANDERLHNLVWYDVFAQEESTCDWTAFQLCLGYENRLFDLNGQEVNKYGRWVRFAANRPNDDAFLVERIINAYELSIAKSVVEELPTKEPP